MRELIRAFVELSVIRNHQLAYQSVSMPEGIKASEFLARTFKDWITPKDARMLLYFVTLHVLEDVGLLGRDGAIKDVCNEDEIDHVTNVIFNYWSATPRSYAFFLPMPGIKDLGVARIDVSQGIALLNLSEEGLLEEIRAPVAANKEGCYLRIESIGLMYFGNANESAYSDAMRAFKHFSILGGVSGALSSVFELGTPPTAINTLDLIDNSKAIRVTLPATIGPILLQTFLSSSVVLTLAGLLGNPAEKPAPLVGEALTARIQRDFADIGKVIDEARKFEMQKIGGKKDGENVVGQHCARIVGAAEWLFDAKANSGTAVGYVQACIAFEALYGGDKPIGLTIANRAAYALGATISRRDDTFNRLRKFYDRRSEIVHSGGTRLSNNDVETLSWAEKTLERALRHEIGLVPET